MNTKTVTFIRSALILGLLTAAFASQASSYKMVQLKDDAQHQADLPTVQEIKFDDAMNRCVQLTTTATLQAQAACHQAVMHSRYAAGTHGKASRTMKAYAYSNRGVQKLKQQDKVGALADFQMAVELNADDITRHNLSLLVKQLNSADAAD